MVAMEISLHSHKKGLSSSPIGKRQTLSLVQCQAFIFVCAHWRHGCYVLIGHSCRSANIAKTALQTVGCASIKSREKMTHMFVSILIRPEGWMLLMSIYELNWITPCFRWLYFDGYCSIAYYVFICNNHLIPGQCCDKGF